MDSLTAIEKELLNSYGVKNASSIADIILTEYMLEQKIYKPVNLFYGAK